MKKEIIIGLVIGIIVGLIIAFILPISNVINKEEKTMTNDVPWENIGYFLVGFENSVEDGIELWKTHEITSANFRIKIDGNPGTIYINDCRDEFERLNYPAVENEIGKPINYCGITQIGAYTDGYFDCKCYYPQK